MTKDTLCTRQVDCTLCPKISDGTLVYRQYPQGQHFSAEKCTQNCMIFMLKGELLKDAVYVGTSVAGAFVVTYGMKYLIDRERPFDRYPDRVHAYSHETSPSFPSGHTATAFALATSLCVKYPKWYVIAPSALWACSVGVSRMNEGVHYPSDVLAGAAIGAGCAVVNIYVNRWLNKWLFGN